MCDHTWSTIQAAFFWYKTSFLIASLPRCHTRIVQQDMSHHEKTVVQFCRLFCGDASTHHVLLYEYWISQVNTRFETKNERIIPAGPVVAQLDRRTRKCFGDENGTKLKQPTTSGSDASTRNFISRGGGVGAPRERGSLATM